MVIRAATAEDLHGIIAIENREIECSFAHFSTTPVSLEHARSAFDLAQGRYPWFVADDEGVVGFARCGPWKPREAYRWTTEIGVYVTPVRQGRGVGRRLYAELFPAMKGAGFRTVMALIALPNPASVRLHETFGMSHVGTVPKAGFKCGAWRDVGYWALHWDGDEAAGDASGPA